MPGRPDDPKSPLNEYWDKPVSDLAAVENATVSEADAERHTIFSLLTMSLVSDTFNGNKRGAVGDYPWREKQKISDHRYQGDSYGDRYLGHNIASLAVDGRGEIIDFDFNHNDLFNSSAEHAEARLVRRIFNLNQSFDHWQTVDPKDITDVPYATVLSAVTIYTTLESCAQCSGIMTLGNVKRVVYLQSDPGQYRIGNILYNLSNPLGVTNPSTHPSKPGEKPTKYGAPEPVGADGFAFSYKGKLENCYADYVQGVAQKSFFRSIDGKEDKSPSITSFLCTDAAKSIFDAAAADLNNFELTYPDYVPAATEVLPSLSNVEVLRQAQRFRVYAARAARRATPHR